MKPPITLNIDVVSYCNLRCPSCPTGRRENPKQSTPMPITKFEEALHVVRSRYDLRSVSLFNWTDSALHPQIHRIIDLVKESGAKCRVSTNLNYGPGLVKIIQGEPDLIIVSFSGITPETYNFSHRGGDVKKFLDNLNYLALSFNSRKTRVDATFHVYKHNQHELTAVKSLCERHGFNFRPVTAFYMPIEDVIDGKIDPAVKERLLIEDIDSALERAWKFYHGPCMIREDALTVDGDGNVYLCCATYDPKRFAVGNIFKDSLETIESRKSSHSFCTQCCDSGLMTYAWNPFDVLSGKKKGALTRIYERGFMKVFPVLYRNPIARRIFF